MDEEVSQEEASKVAALPLAHPLAHPWAHLREEGRNSVVGRPPVVEEEGRQAAGCSSSSKR